MAHAEIALGVSPRPRRIAKSKTCREARRDGLAIHLFGTGIRVVGLDGLPVEKALAWRSRFKAEKEALYAELGGTEDPAGAPRARPGGCSVRAAAAYPPMMLSGSSDRCDI